MLFQRVKHEFARLVRDVTDDQSDFLVHHALVDKEVIVRIPETIVPVNEQIRLLQIQYFPVKMQDTLGVGFFRRYVIGRFDVDTTPWGNRRKTGKS